MLTGIISSTVTKNMILRRSFEVPVLIYYCFTAVTGVLGLWFSCGVRDVSYLQLHHHLRLLWPGTDTSGSGRLHLLEPKTNSHCMSNTRTTLKPPFYLCPLQQTALIEKSSWNTDISSEFTWIWERAVDQDCVQQCVPNIWAQQHQTSDDLHMHQTQRWDLISASPWLAIQSRFKSQSTYTHLTISKHCRPQNVSEYQLYFLSDAIHRITLRESYLI